MLDLDVYIYIYLLHLARCPGILHGGNSPLLVLGDSLQYCATDNVETQLPCSPENILNTSIAEDTVRKCHQFESEGTRKDCEKTPIEEARLFSSYGWFITVKSIYKYIYKDFGCHWHPICLL